MKFLDQVLQPLSRLKKALCLAVTIASVESALQWQPSPGYRALPLSPQTSGTAGFSLQVPGKSGIQFTNLLTEQRHLTNQILLNGSGVAAGDIDGDGWTDLYFCGMDSQNVLYRNLGNWAFEDITATAGVACSDLLSTGTALADLDGDSDLDLLVNSIGQGTHLFFNDGTGRFTRAPELLNLHRGGMSAALGDLDGDGFLDLYIANYRTRGLMDIPNARATFKSVNGMPIVETFNGRPTTAPDLTNRFRIGPRGSIEEQGQPDLLLRNIGGTNFSPMAPGAFLDETGNPLAGELVDWGLSAMIRDANGDSIPDIYVCNDFQSEDRFWLGQSNGTFRLIPPLAQRKSSLFSMAVDFADINRDGHDDFFVVDMLSREHSQRMRDMADQTPTIYRPGEIGNRPQYSLNTLFLNRGDHTYAEVGQLSGVQASDWSWSCVFLDVDLDGWEDILISNGMERAARDLDVADRLKAMRATRRMSDAEIFRARKMFPRLATRNMAFHNQRDLTFREESAGWNFDHAGVSHGMALADLDNDGDLDVVINNLNAPAGVYRNESGAPRIAVRLKGKRPNTRGVGAKIEVQAKGLPLQSQEIIAGGRYLSSDDTIRTFAVGSGGTVDVKVRWRDGSSTELVGLKPNHLYEIEQIASASPSRTPPAPEHWFDDVSERLGHVHAEQPHDESLRQPLLPRKLSQRGPPAVWEDLNEDGWEDLVIGSSRGGQLKVFLNLKDGNFRSVTSAPFDPVLERSVAGLAGLRRSGLNSSIIATLSNYEDGLGYGPALQSYSLGDAGPNVIAQAWNSAAGPVALGDVDGDGDLDLFVGGSVIPGRYPAAASSRLYLHNDGSFEMSPQSEQHFQAVGLVSDAQFADFDNDADMDLLIACEWGALRLFLNEKGRFSDATESFRLEQYKGLWQAVAVGDFDADGQLDFVAANWGKNSRHQPTSDHPIRLYHGDFDDDGRFDIIESHYEAALAKYVPDRQRSVLAEALPVLNQRFRSHAQYSTASVEDVLGGMLSRAKVTEANWLETTVFLNRRSHFEPRVLPVEAQFSPALDVCVGDFDKDGHDDLVLAQNYFAVQPETPRYDAGRGLLLKGDGKGSFAAVPGQVSGLRIYGEQRSVSAADFDQDGWLDLVVTQNGAETKLYRNRGRQPAE